MEPNQSSKLLSHANNCSSVVAQGMELDHQIPTLCENRSELTQEVHN